MIKKSIKALKTLKRHYSPKTFPLTEKISSEKPPISITTPEYTLKTLTNGIQTLIETPEIPKYVTLNIYLKGGLAYETAENSGYFKWLENSILKKISNYPKVEINTAVKLERDGLEITANMLSNQVEEYLDVFSSFFRPDILDAEILNEMEYICEEDKEIKELLVRNSYNELSYGKPLIGLKQNYEDKTNFSYKARELHNKVINAEDILISAGGIYNTDSFLELLDKKFSFIPKTRSFTPPLALITPKNYFAPSLKKSKQFFHSETDMFANQVGIAYKIQGASENHEKNLLLNELIGESSYFMSEGPGKGVYLLAADAMRNCYPASEVGSFFQTYENNGVFGIYLKGIENSQSVLMKGLVKLLENLKGGVKEDYFFRARNILKRKFMQNLENQFERLPVLTRRFVYTGQVGFEGFYEKVDQVSLEEMEMFIEEVFKGDKSFVGIGPLDERSFR